MIQARSFLVPTLANRSVLPRTRPLSAMLARGSLLRDRSDFSPASRVTERDLWPSPMSNFFKNWDGFGDPLWDEMDKALAQFPRSSLSPFLAKQPDFSSFHVDFAETDNDYKLTADLPGIKKENIKMDIRENVLSIEAERKAEEEEEKEGSYHRKEIFFGKFRRVLQLPHDADMDTIEASFADGVLKVSMGKKQESETGKKTIDIK